MKKFAVAVDGPAGSGKSTVAKEIAKALGIRRAKTIAYLEELAAEELVEALGEDPDKIYRLKS